MKIFGVASALLFYSLSSLGVLGIVMALFFVTCSMLGLARYNKQVLKVSPVTVNGLFNSGFSGGFYF